MASHRSAHRANARRPRNWLAEPLESRRLLSSAAVFGAVDRFTVDSTVGGQLVRLGDYGYFSAGPAAGDYALYRTDLTPSGTAPILGNFTTAP